MSEQMMTECELVVKDEDEKLRLCDGCRDDYYNHREKPGFDGATRCWSLKTAEIVARYRIGWWTAQDSPKNYTPVRTLSCHHRPGGYAHFRQLPQHLIAEAVRLGIPVDPSVALTQE
jgi:hypothetical protein